MSTEHPRDWQAEDCAEYVHEMTCPNQREHGRVGCPASMRPTAIRAALVVLDEHPRDAAGARGVLHDLACYSGCTGASRDDHAKRTLSQTVAAIRKWRALEVRAA